MSSRLNRLRKSRIPFRRNQPGFGLDGGDDSTGGGQEDLFTGFGVDDTTTQQSSAPTPSLEISDEEGITIGSGGSRRVKKTALESLLEFQKEYFGKRITTAGNQRKRLAPWYPWVELRKRTTPLPNIQDYLVAIANASTSQFSGLLNNVEPSTFIQDRNIGQMFDISDAIFGGSKEDGNKSGSVIILLRKNKKAQVIFPGRSTTSYKTKNGQTVQFVWTSSVEFNWVDYSSLPPGNVGAGTVTKANEETPIDILVTKDITDVGKVESNLSLTNSVSVAENYIIDGWLPSKSNRTQERLNYRLFYFSERDNLQYNDGMGLRYEGSLLLKERLQDLESMDDVTMTQLSGLSQEQKSKIKMNPQRQLTDRSSSNKRRYRLTDKSSKPKSRLSRFKKRRF